MAFPQASNTVTDNSHQSPARVPFLKPEHVNGRVQACIEPSIRIYHDKQYGSKIIVGVSLQTGGEFEWSTRIGGKQQIALYEKLGANLLTWPGKIITIERQSFRDEKNGGRETPFIAVV